MATEDTIRRLFGPMVAEIVRGCTDADKIPKPPWRQRKEQYIAHLKDASPSVRLVSASDTLHNARTVLSDYQRMGEGVWELFNGGREGTLWYYRSPANLFSRLGPLVLGKELDLIVTELERQSSQPSASGT